MSEMIASSKPSEHNSIEWLLSSSSHKPDDINSSTELSINSLVDSLDHNDDDDDDDENDKHHHHNHHNVVLDVDERNVITNPECQRRILHTNISTLHEPQLPPSSAQHDSQPSMIGIYTAKVEAEFGGDEVTVLSHGSALMPYASGGMSMEPNSSTVAHHHHHQQHHHQQHHQHHDHHQPQQQNNVCEAIQNAKAASVSRAVDFVPLTPLMPEQQPVLAHQVKLDMLDITMSCAVIPVPPSCDSVMVPSTNESIVSNDALFNSDMSVEAPGSVLKKSKHSSTKSGKSVKIKNAKPPTRDLEMGAKMLLQLGTPPHVAMQANLDCPMLPSAQLLPPPIGGPRLVVSQSATMEENELELGELIGDVAEGTEVFRCGACNKIFSKKTDLLVHARGHARERPFTCPKCNKSFKERFGLKRHIRTHTGERPYKCDTCGRRFAEAGNLRRHIRLHSGDRPFVCESCSKTFAQRSNHQKHFETCRRRIAAAASKS